MKNKEIVECIISLLLHKGFKIDTADEIVNKIFHDVDEHCEKEYFLARLTRIIEALNNAKEFVENIQK